MIAQVIPSSEIEAPWDEPSSAMVPAGDGVTAISYPVREDAGVDWMLRPRIKRMSIDNATRRGFIDKKTGEIFETFVFQLLSANPLNSHKQPNPNNPKEAYKPQHASGRDWCESWDRKQTNIDGMSCAGCPAMKDCSFKMELKMVVQMDGEPVQYLLTIPTVSALRYLDAANQLHEKYDVMPNKVLWRASLEVDKNDNGEVFPVAVFTPFNSAGEDYQLDAPKPKQAAPKPPQPTRAPAPTPIMRVDPVKAGRQAQAAQQAVATMPKASALTAGIRPDKGDAEDATEALNDLAEAHSRSKPPNESKIGVIRQAAAIELGKTMLKDDELRHAFISHHYTGTANGSLAELGWIELLALRDWAGRKDAKAYIEWWVKDHNANTVV